MTDDKAHDQVFDLSGVSIEGPATCYVPANFDTATGKATVSCPFCCMVTVAESEACGVEETFWDMDQQCSHFRRFVELRAVFEGPFEMLEGSDA